MGEAEAAGEAAEKPPAPVSAEVLLEAARRRTVADCGGGELPADVIRSLCTDRAAEVDRYGLRIRDAVVTGVLDLRATAVPFALELAGCEVAEAPVVEGAALHSLAFRDGTRLPGLLANGVRLRRDLDLSGAEVWGALSTTASTSQTAAIWLTEAEVGGRLLCVGTRIVGPADRCIQADRTRFGGNIRLLHGFVTDGEVRLLAVHLDGSLDLSGARLLPKNGRALDLAESYVGGSIFVIDDEATPGSHGPEIRGRVELGHTTVSGRIFVRNTTIVAPPAGAGTHRYFDRASETMHRHAVDAPRLSVVGDIELAACRVEGGLDLTAADVKGTVILDGLVVRNPGDRSIDLTNATVGGDLSAVGLRAQGSVHLTGAHVRGSVRLVDAYLSRPVEPADLTITAPVLLAGEGLEVARDLDLRRLVTRGGEVRFSGARLGASLYLGAARLLYGRGYAVTFHQAVVSGSVHLGRGFRARGLVAFNRATIDGRLDVNGGTFCWPGEPVPGFNRYDAAFWAIGATVRGGMSLGWRRVVGGVDLSDATTTYLADDPTRWGDSLRITGFTYDRFAPLSDAPADSKGNWDVGDRVRWLAGQDALDPGPFEQAARVYRQHGRTADAEDVLIQGLRLIRQRGAPAEGSPRRRIRVRVRRALGRAGDWVFDRTVGYGYRTGRAIGLLVALVAVTALVLALPAATTAMRASGSDGSVYTPDGPLTAAGPGSPATPPSTPVTATPDACGDGAVRCYQPLLLAIDTVVPIIDLGQRSTWYPSHHDGAGWAYEAWLNVATVLGWAISTVFALSFTRLARST